jgi:glycosyltransferase involved in cell wall biosynthesis
MHATIVSTYPPRACGLATFARDLRGGLLSAGLTSDVVSVVQEPAGPARRPEVVAELRQHERAAYAAAAERVVVTEADVVCVQHEFGIFGGPEGGYVLDLMGGVRRPVVTTLHTVLPDPPDHYRRATLAVAGRSDRLVVMTRTARDLLRDVYGVPPPKVAVIPHGTPGLDPRPDPETKRRLGLEGRTVLLTFGLLGPSKGVEFALGSLARAVEAQPDLLYVVLGSTHPEIVKREGEAYRERLGAEVVRRGLERHVRFEDRFVDTDDLWDWLTSADVYVSPYPGMDQICSGTLAYALAAGLPVVSTPYLHAREVLADGAGVLVPYGDADAFGAALARFAADPDARAEAAERARAFGATTTWAQTGAAYAALFAEVAGRPRAEAPPDVHPGALPASVGYLARITDDTGPTQHAAFGVPDRAHGYCTDDAGRALVAAYAAARRLEPGSPGRREALDVARTCLAFVHHAQRPDGAFHNFMDYGRRFLDAVGGEDTLGRALWGLGAAHAWAPEAPTRLLARALIDRALARDLTHPRAIAYAACGLDLALERSPDLVAYRDRLRDHGARLVEQFERCSTSDWRWFCDEVTYGNALVPHALLRAAARLDGDGPAGRFREVALDAYDFLLAHTVRDGAFDVVGNRGWLRKGGGRADYDQQPIDAGYAAWCGAWAWRETGEERFAEAARLAVAWFYGRNRVGQPLFDVQTGACFDGFSAHGVNLNQGAESSLACVLAHLAAADLGLVAEVGGAGAGGAGAPPVRQQAPPERGVSP